MMKRKRSSRPFGAHAARKIENPMLTSAQREIRAADSPCSVVMYRRRLAGAAVVRTLFSVPSAHLAVEVVVVAVLEGGAAAAARAALAAARLAALPAAKVDASSQLVHQFIVFIPQFGNFLLGLAQQGPELSNAVVRFQLR